MGFSVKNANSVPLVDAKTVRMCCRLRVPALHALPPATPSAGRSPHRFTRTLLARPRRTHLRTHSWAWEGMSRRPSLRVRIWYLKYGWKLCAITFRNDLFIFFASFKGPRRNLRNDLLIAADSITNTMSSLVKELNSGKKEWKNGVFCFLTFYTTAVLKCLFSHRGWKWDWEHCGFRLWTRWPVGHHLFRSVLHI